jgi:hypothetical protein
VLDAAKQRQHIGNDTVNIFFKHGTEMPECNFRGKVNACALVVMCPDESSNELVLGCFHRSWIEGFEPHLGRRRYSIQDVHDLRETLFTNAINASALAVKSGPYRVNRLRLFDQAIGELVALEDVSATPQAATPEVSSPAKRAGLMTQKTKDMLSKATSKDTSVTPIPSTSFSAATSKDTSAGTALSTDDASRKPVGEEIRVGWLMKRHSIFKGKWKKRWCVLLPDGLHYFEKDGDLELGVILFTGMKDCEMAPDASFSRKNPPFFVLNCLDGDRYEFYTLNESDMKVRCGAVLWCGVLVAKLCHVVRNRDGFRLWGRVFLPHWHLLR